MKGKYMWIALAIFSIASCKSKIEPETPVAGNADFSRYVAIGNSLTAGFSDGTLYRSGQENSYPAMLAAQFSLVGGGEFKQPLLPGEAGWPSLRRVLRPATDCKGVTSLSPRLYDGTIDTAGSGTNVAAAGPYNNMGIPGIRCIDFALPGYGTLNPYAARVYSNPATQNPLQASLGIDPTFFTIWLGSNDVLGYATAGGVGSTAGILPNDISPVATFKTVYDGVVASFTNNGAKGVLINLPDVTSIPYFTTINPMGLVLDATQAQALTAAYQPLGITFSEGANYFIIQDITAPGGLRQIKSGEYILITTPGDSLKCAGWGSLKPIPGQYVLTADEVANVQTATTAFNNIIADAAARHGLALMDANSYLKRLQSGIKWSGVTYSPTFVTGGAFSLDGIHLTPRGYALVTNEIIRVINQNYQSTLPDVDVNKYGGVRFP